MCGEPEEAIKVDRDKVVDELQRLVDHLLWEARQKWDADGWEEKYEDLASQIADETRLAYDRLDRLKSHNLHRTSMQQEGFLECAVYFNDLLPDEYKYHGRGTDQSERLPDLEDLTEETHEQ